MQSYFVSYSRKYTASEAIDLANRYPNVYLNTSFVFFQYILESAVARCPEKILFGSDSPGVHPLTAITTILTLNISNELKQMLFHGNIARILET